MVHGVQVHLGDGIFRFLGMNVLPAYKGTDSLILDHQNINIILELVNLSSSLLSDQNLLGMAARTLLRRYVYTKLLVSG